MAVLLIVLAIAGWIVASMVYVYRFRGRARFESFGEYLRKGWPLFSPLNCLLYVFTQKRARRPIMDMADFPELSPIRENWQTIRAEVQALHEQQVFDQTNNPDSSAYYDLGFRTFYKYGWSKFYLKWYGTTHRSAQATCPQTLKILEQVPSVNGAMFSVLPPGSQLTRHCDPIACSMRYHLGLDTPNNDACYINVDGEDYAWRDGEAFLFDETCLHYAHNETDQNRLILMCDVERPTWFVGRLVNFCYKGLTRLTVVPNTEEDERGLVNTVFAGVAPTITRVRGLKQTHPRRYRTIKYTVNSVLAVNVIGMAAAGIYGIYLLGAMVF